MALTSRQLRDLARHGAAVRLSEIGAEIASIRGAFPDVGGARPGRKQGRPAAAPVKRRRRVISAAARKAISVRMTKYWAARRAGSKK